MILLIIVSNGTSVFWVFIYFKEKNISITVSQNPSFHSIILIFKNSKKKETGGCLEISKIFNHVSNIIIIHLKFSPSLRRGFLFFFLNKKKTFSSLSKFIYITHSCSHTSLPNYVTVVRTSWHHWGCGRTDVICPFLHPVYVRSLLNPAFRTSDEGRVWPLRPPGCSEIKPHKKATLGSTGTQLQIFPFDNSVGVGIISVSDKHTHTVTYTHS